METKQIELVGLIEFTKRVSPKTVHACPDWLERLIKYNIERDVYRIDFNLMDVTDLLPLPLPVLGGTRQEITYLLPDCLKATSRFQYDALFAKRKAER